MLTDSSPFDGIPAGARILLAFSGGIDSSAAACLALRAGFDVLPVYLDLLPGRDHERVRAVADKLGLPLRILDFTEEFRDTVMRRCWEEYRRGRTPNPCALCNPLFKFGKLLEFAKENQCAAMATGHYARVVRGPRPALYRGTDRHKDQSYFLFGLSEEQLNFCCFPLESHCKREVRALVSDLRLPNASDPESQDICFARDGVHVGELLRETFHASARPGNFVSPDGTVLGRHAGIHTYTPGQRKGTGVALGKPAYVRCIHADRAEVELVTDGNLLLSPGLTCSGLVSHADLPAGPFRAEVQIRYRSKSVPATVTLLENARASVVFDTPVRAVTPGQAAVFYDGERQLAGGWIDGDTSGETQTRA